MAIYVIATMTFSAKFGENIECSALIDCSVSIKVCALQPATENKSINLGTTNLHKIDMALKIVSCDIISPVHCLTNLKIVNFAQYFTKI